MKKTSSSSEQGAALIITLFFVVITTVVVVGFLDSVRVDRVASNSHFERNRAATLARSGVEATVATLQRETVDRSRNWVSQPGALTVPDRNDNTSYRLEKTADLSSGKSSLDVNGGNVDPMLAPPNLNVQFLADPDPNSHLLRDKQANETEPVEMRPRWVYVREDGTLDMDGAGVATELPDTSNRANPIVGRYAYWADDESSKINYNLAWTRDSKNPFPPGHPTRVDLRALPDFDAKADDAAGADSFLVADALHAFVSPESPYDYKGRLNFFTTPFDARRIESVKVRKAVARNKFNLTHYNSDPDTTYYGKNRMVLTTQLRNAVFWSEDGKDILLDDKGLPITRPFLDILAKSPTSLSPIDPGMVNTIDKDKLDKVVSDLVNNYLKRSDWPLVNGTGGSIQDKYYQGYSGAAKEQRLTQLALNIIDYVRSAESSSEVVEPIRGKYLNGETKFTPDWANSAVQGQEDTFKGLTRAPMITEMALWVSPNRETVGPNINRYRTVGMVEVHLPANYGLTGLNMYSTNGGQRWKLWWADIRTLIDSSGAFNGAGKPMTTEEWTVGYRKTRDVVYGTPSSPAPDNETWNYTPCFIKEAVGDDKKGKLVIDPAQPDRAYLTILVEYWRTSPITSPKLRSAITLTGVNAKRIDVVPLSNASNQFNYKMDPVAFEGDINSIETADPRVNGVSRAWKIRGVGTGNGLGNTFGRRNDAYSKIVGKPPLDEWKAFEQDLDQAGQVTDVSMRMPAPYDTKINPVHPGNKTGRVLSAAELGVIHTGIEGSSSTSLPHNGVPFRSLHLQPSKQPTTVVPDWAFMDLFTVPVNLPGDEQRINAKPMLSPHQSSTAGRVNMNAQPVPFDIDRIDPLTAVFTGVRWSAESSAILSKTQAEQIARNIYNRTLSPGSSVLPAGKAYPSPGAGIPTVYESPGEVVEIAGVADKGEASEELLREVANLITARGNVFSVYTIGQSLRQTPNGKLIVTAENRQQAMVERYLVTKDTNPQEDDEVKVRTIYVRDLSP